MPGLVGLLTRMPRAQAELELLRMVEAMRHENFYVTGTWQDPALGIYVGWIARKDSCSDGMPLSNERGDVVLVFSGEEFPEPGTQRRLIEQGHRLDVPGPSYLAHLYEGDPSFPEGLNGRFHGLLTDRRRGTATLFNDRYGMHRVYYHQSPDAFYFAAEAKAILAVRPELRAIDPRGLAEFVTCGSVLEDRTLFTRVRALPGAAAWVFRAGSLESQRTYFQPRAWEDQPSLEPEAYYQELRDVYSRTLPRYFQGAEPIAMSLTGGLDTRMIMAWQKPAPGSLPCYTFGGMRRDCQDVQVARRIASLCGQSHEVITVGREFLSRFPRYAERTVYLTEGSVDVGRAPDLFLNERARGIAPVRMTGNYGGEILRGVRAFKAVEPLPGLFAPDLGARINDARATYAGLVEAHPVTFAAFTQGPWHHAGVLGLEETQLSLRSPYLDNDLVRTAFRAPQSALANTDVCLRLIAEAHPALGAIRTDRGVGGAGGPLAAAASRGLLEFLFKAEYAYDMGMPQSLARVDHALSRLHLERLFLGRHKLTHFRLWYRDVLAGYVREVLLDERSLRRPYLERKQLEAVVEGHVRGERNYTTEIHKVLTLELLHRLLLDGAPMTPRVAAPAHARSR
jgi:asparagine synthase (glutamine-hydrolysing)